MKTPEQILARKIILAEAIHGRLIVEGAKDHSDSELERCLSMCVGNNLPRTAKLLREERLLIPLPPDLTCPCCGSRPNSATGGMVICVNHDDCKIGGIPIPRVIWNDKREMAEYLKEITSPK